jgi:choline dehydrogenase
MGIDPMSVVDPDLKVHGLSRLRIVDSSVFPTIPNGNLNAPTMMLAERGADLIKGSTIQPKHRASVYINEHWQTSQK